MCDSVEGVLPFLLAELRQSFSLSLSQQDAHVACDAILRVFELKLLR